MNQALFLYFNAQSGDAAIVRMAGVWLAQYLNVVVAVLLSAYLLLSRQNAVWRKTVLSCVLAMTVAYVIAGLYYYPRPFMLGLGQTLVPYHDTSSFPSRVVIG